MVDDPDAQTRNGRMKLVTSCALAGLVLFAFHPTSSARAETKQGSSTESEDLCELLAGIRPGQTLRVSLKGVFVSGFETRYFFDASSLDCAWDVQPETWVDFAKGVDPGALYDVLGKADNSSGVKRVAAVLEGELQGPRSMESQDFGRQPALAYANRMKSSRYGHLPGFPTRLLVTGIRDVQELDESEGWPPARAAAGARVVGGVLPHYPEMARRAGVSGSVVLLVSVTDGKVSQVEILSGDPLLQGEAERSVRSWTFDAGATARIVTEFDFELETRRRGAPSSDRLELRLPDHVRVVGAREGW